MHRLHWIRPSLRIAPGRSGLADLDANDDQTEYKANDGTRLGKMETTDDQLRASEVEKEKLTASNAAY